MCTYVLGDIDNDADDDRIVANDYEQESIFPPHTMVHRFSDKLTLFLANNWH